MSQSFHFYDEAALLERLSKGIRKREQEVVFLVGAPLSAPLVPGTPGVPGVDGVIQLIRREFDDELQLTALDTELTKSGEKQYQTAFLFLQGRRGQHAVNEVVRKAVLAARNSGPAYVGADFDGTGDDACRLMELDTTSWTLSPGTENLGKLMAGYPTRFGRCVLTTNFDPLIEVSIRKAGGQHWRTTLHLDGNLSQTEADGSQVVHLHGYWYGSDTLHTPRQLGQARPRLRASLSHLLRHKLVVVCAYGGWDDSFTDALMDVVRDDSAFPEIIWTFNSPTPSLSENLMERLEPGIDRGRVNLYGGIDCHRFFPALCDRWLSLETAAAPKGPSRSNPVYVSTELGQRIALKAHQQTVLEGDDEDRPPRVEICVGREDESAAIEHSSAKVVFLTGIGGQGKSTLASRYFEKCQTQYRFSFYSWRDCKEERERFENELASVVEKLSEGRIRGEDLANQTASSIVQLLINLIKDVRVLFVFDNVDHYVDLEKGTMTGTADTFIRALLASGSMSRAVFTCRPSVAYEDRFSISRHLAGISLEATATLFSERGASVTASEIQEAHILTNGHAFWLDLLAVQAAKGNAGGSLTSFLDEIRSGRGLLPENTLDSIWGTLKDREQTVLRAMAETVKPETESAIGEYLRHQMNYGKAIKALNTLRALNLIVIKQRPNAPDLLELHPLVRRYVQHNFPQQERKSFINEIIKVYRAFIGAHRSQLLDQPPLSLLQYWTQDAELDIAAGRTADAFVSLADVSTAFLSGAYPREFCRTARALLASTDWRNQHKNLQAFEGVFWTHVRLLSYIGEHPEVDELLARYEETIPGKDARYINYCEMRCFSQWVRGEFSEAVKWGSIGDNLKRSSGVDTKIDIAHILALAQRDAGQPELALGSFLHGRTLAEVLDPEELDEQRGGHFYGNIGRCLYFMGQVDGALVCYQKSALLVEKDASQEHVRNQGYIRAWIGEALVAREQWKLAYVFLRSANEKWEQAFPAKASKVLELSEQIVCRISPPPVIDSTEAERISLDWILGRSPDPRF